MAEDSLHMAEDSLHLAEDSLHLAEHSLHMAGDMADISKDVTTVDTSATEPVRMRQKESSDVMNKDRPGSVTSEDNPNDNTLEDATCQFDLEKVIEILDEGSVDVNEPNSDGKNALHEMMERYRQIDRFERSLVHGKLVAILTKLVEKGLDVNAHVRSGKGTAMNNSRYTALHIAASSANSGDIIRSLFTSGADVNVEDGHKRTPLHVATERSLLSNVIALIDGGADLNKQDEYNETPLHYAVKGRNKSTAVVKALIDAGANTNARDTTRKTPVHLAAKHSNVKVMKLLLLHGGQVTKTDGTGQTPIHYASVHDCSGEVLKQLLNIASDVNKQDAVSMESPLHKAVRHHMTDNVITLCETGLLDANIQDLFGETPIHKAVKLSDWNMWIALLKCGGDVYKENHLGVTPLTLLKREHNKLGPMISKYHRHRTTEV